MLYRPLFAAVAAVFATASPALAQQDWTGFYVGLNGGASWGDTKLNLQLGSGAGPFAVPPADVAGINQIGSDDDNKTSFTGGIQGGYNYQSGSLILGIETDIGFFDISQRRTNVYASRVLINPPIAYALDQRVKTDWIWTLRPRIGYASDQWMGYITGGIATSKTKLETQVADNRNPQNIAQLSKDDTDTGWVGGLGAAYAFSPNMSVRGEWLYVDFGKIHETVTGPNGFVTVTPEATVKGNIFRVGVDYKF
ncbi:MAG: outer membrane protein [Phenylobacterium sp.]